MSLWSRLQAYWTPRWVLGTVFGVSLLMFIGLLWAPRVDGNLVGSDGIYYYVFARSLIIDRDIDFTNEYIYFQLSVADAKTPTGLAPNIYAIGPAILWMPFFGVAHGLAQLGERLGWGTISDGYGYLYQAAISLGSIVYGAIGLVLAYRVAAHLTRSAAALAAVVGVWAASNFIYYMVFEPSMSHMVSLCSVALLLSIWFWYFRSPNPPSWRWAAALGAAGGLVMLVRLQDATFLLIPYGTILWAWVRTLQRGASAAAWRWFGLGVLTLGLTLLVFLPQMLVWHTLYGTWLSSPYASVKETTFYWFQPQIFNVLFSSYHGLFSWHPIYLLALIGLGLAFRRERGLITGMLVMLGLAVYLVAAWWAWWQGDAFGGRMFLNATWIWVVGLAFCFESMRSARQRWLVAALIGALIVWNGLALVQYRLGFVPMNQPLTLEQMTVDRVRLPWLLLERLQR